MRLSNVADALHPRPAGRLLTALVCVCLVLTISGCPSSGLPRGDDVSKAQKFARQGRYADAAQAYERAAAAGSGEQRRLLHLDASRAWLEAGQISRALATLSRVSPPLPMDDPAIAMLEAYRALRDGNALAALEQLNRQRAALPNRYLGLWYELRGRALITMGDVSAGVAVLSERETWLDDSASIEANRDLIWRLLNDAAQRGNPLVASEDADQQTRGWLALAQAVQSARSDPFGARAALLGWADAYTSHAADAIAQRLLSPLPEALEYPSAVAVLLPLTGRLGSVGEAVRDGFMAAYLHDTSDQERPAVRFYDTSAGGDAALGAALSDGASFVIGPLQKDHVVAAATVVSGVPLLALNYLPDGAGPRANFFQFSLAPEHEASEVARRAHAENLNRAVALVPDSPWGMRLLEAFSQTLTELGGELLDYRVYQVVDRDFRVPITELLNLNESRERYRQVRAVTGLDLEFQPRRRRDVQMVFIAANEEQGRLIRPSFQYHYAEDLPIFATSAVYQDDPQRNKRDLEGLVFADMPWVLAPDQQTRAVQEQMRRYFPDENQSRARLYALGFDAYRLIPRLLSGENPLAEPWSGATGVLSMGAGGRIQRSLEVARIHNGAAVPLPPLEVYPEYLGFDDPEATGAPDPMADDAAVTAPAGGAPDDEQ